MNFIVKNFIVGLAEEIETIVEEIQKNINEKLTLAIDICHSNDATESLIR